MRHKLIRALAAGEVKPAELARRHSVSREAMRLFAQRHADRIAEAKANLDDVFAGIEFADKSARVAELSNDVGEIAQLLADPETAARAGVGLAEMLRAKQSALRNISEELGQLPSRMSVQVGGQLDVTIGGVDVSALK